MIRKEFLKIIGLGTAGVVLPPALIKNKPIKIYDNFVKGVAYYGYKSLRKSIKEGDKLTLVREVDNTFDGFALAIYFEGNKLGYISAYENIVLANMLDAGVEMTAFVGENRREGNVYDSISVEIFTDLVLPTKKLITAINSCPADQNRDVYRNGIVIS